MPTNEEFSRRIARELDQNGVVDLNIDVALSRLLEPIGIRGDAATRLQDQICVFGFCDGFVIVTPRRPPAAGSSSINDVRRVLDALGGATAWPDSDGPSKI